MRRALDLLHNARFAEPVPFEAAMARVQASFGIDLSRARVRSGFSRGHLLDAVVYLPGGRGDPREGQAAETAVRLLIGEELFERWLGSVSAAPGTRGGPLTVLNSNAEEHSALPLQTLLEAFQAAISGLKRGLSAEPLARQAETEDWVLFELEPEPEPAPDYAAQDDLLIASTRLPELKKSFLRREPFFSGRFSNAGELFAYLKYETALAPNEARHGEARLRERARLEAELTRALRPEHGALVGSGLGLRYAYLDLALLDPDCVEAALLPALRAAGIASRAWLLFCDSELDREWLPVHPDTPEPFWG